MCSQKCRLVGFWGKQVGLVCLKGRFTWKWVSKMVEFTSLGHFCTEPRIGGRVVIYQSKTGDSTCDCKIHSSRWLQSLHVDKTLILRCWCWKVVCFGFERTPKNPGWLGYIGDYTTQICGDYNTPLEGSLLNNRMLWCLEDFSLPKVQKERVLRDWSWYLAASDWILRIQGFLFCLCSGACCQKTNYIPFTSNSNLYQRPWRTRKWSASWLQKCLEDLKQWMATSGETSLRHFVPCRRKRMEGIWDGWIPPWNMHRVVCLKFLATSSTFLRFLVFWQLFLSQHQQSL